MREERFPLVSDDEVMLTEVSQVLDGTESRGSLTLAEIREILGISEAST